MEIEKKVRSYILENFLFSDNESDLESGDSFLQKGILDSTGILEVIYFIEDEFGVKINDDEMVPENLDSVNNIVAFVGQKLAK